MDEEIGVVEENHLGRLGHDVVDIFRPFHDRVDFDFVAADLPGNVGVIGGGGDDLEIGLRGCGRRIRSAKRNNILFMEMLRLQC